MKIVNCVLVALGLIFLTSCATSRHPVGLPLDEDLSTDLTHRWVNPEGTMHVHCDAEGNLQLGVTEWNADAGKFEIQTLKGPLLRLNDDFYIVNYRDEPDEDDDDNYSFGLVKLDDEKVICWQPRADALRELVEDGELEGEVTDHGAVLTGDGAKIAKKLAAKPLAEMFNWEEPATFWRSKN